MSKSLLLPNKFKKVGWLLLLPGCFLGLLSVQFNYELPVLDGKIFAFANTDITAPTKFFTWIETNATNTLAGIFCILGGLLVSFSRERVEDEYISKLRLSSLMWAFLASYLLLLLAFIFVYGTVFINVMVYNMFTVMIIFICRFNYLLYRNSKMSPVEK